ncbi:MAG: SRPBCC family protein [Bacteroidota bacterium]|nr:SRPBCC family protein [Bacteroidota bacterium]
MKELLTQEPEVDTRDREATFSRFLNAPRQLVYEAFTDRAHVARWWGPDGFTITTHAMDVREGGMWRYIMHGPDGKDYSNRIRYIGVKPPEKLVYEHGEDEEEDPLRFHVTITFDQQNGGTLVTMRILFASAAQWQETRKYAEPGHVQTMNKLEHYLAKLMKV